jgi:hypothetical protein
LSIVIIALLLARYLVFLGIVTKALTNLPSTTTFPLTVQLIDKQAEAPHSGFTITAPDVSGKVNIYLVNMSLRQRSILYPES